MRALDASVTASRPMRNGVDPGSLWTWSHRRRDRGTGSQLFRRDAGHGAAPHACGQREWILPTLEDAFPCIHAVPSPECVSGRIRRMWNPISS
jgi:hypothetical protein